MQRMTILLFSGLLFLMIGILAVLFIAALRSTTASIEYMLYRYMVTGQYTSAPIAYWKLVIPCIALIVIGVVLCVAYMLKKGKEKTKDVILQ